MPIPIEYEIDFSGDFVDLTDRGVTRFLNQFRKSPVLISLLEALEQEAQLLSLATTTMMEERTIYAASGSSLEAIGRIVGITRLVSPLTPFNLLSEAGDQIITELGDYLQAWIPVLQSVDDDMYKMWLLMKIIKNHNKYSSIPELSDAFLQNTGYPIEMRTVGPMQADIIVPKDFPDELLNVLVQMVAYPVTLSFIVWINNSLLSEAGDTILSEAGDNIIVAKEIYWS